MKTENTTTYEVLFADAQVWVDAYQAGKPDGTIKGFLIAADELAQIINLSDQVKYVRIYLGLDEHTPENPAKLIMVPADINGNDMVNTEGANSQVFDFIAPCPPTCAVISPFNPKRLSVENTDQ
jgi:hypothetical protein